MRPNSDPHDIVTSIPYDALNVDQVAQILLFFVSAVGVLGGALSIEGMTRWLNTHLREAVGPTVSSPLYPLYTSPSLTSASRMQVSVASNFVAPWLLNNNAMSLVVHHGVGTELTLSQQATAQQLYNFFVFYVSSPNVMRVSHL
jgi:hypothetical protein